MSPAMKSKSKSSAKPVKEQQQKASSKLLTAPVNGGSSIPVGAYNPISGTFHALEKASSAAPSTPPSNGRFQTIDEREEHSGSSNGNPEYDSVSNGSCSGDSEDPKERAAASAKPQREAIPGSDTDKRDKIRQKNERKHQRQRERRAQELHERCSVYLTSRKLEVLSQQLVAMGFPAERATTALILNEGRVEESIAWLLEGGEGEQLNAAASLDAGSNLRIDISDELAKTADLETEFRCSKQEVERAIVACEGDLEKAAEVLKAQKQEPPVSPSMFGGSGEPAAAIGEHGVAMSGQNAIARAQVKAVNLAVTPQEERDFNYSKAVATGAVPLGSKGRNLQSPRPQTKVDSSSSSSSRPQVPPAVEKRWPGAIANPSVSISYSSASPPPTFLPSPAGAPPAKVEPRYAVVGSEVKTSQRAAALKEPVVVMQRPPQTNSKLPGLPSSTAAASGASPAAATTTTSSGGWWYPSGGVSNVEAVKVSMGRLGASLQTVGPTTRRGVGSSTAQYNMSRHHQPFCMGSRVDTAPVGWGGGTWSNSVGMSSGTSTTTTTSPSSASLTVPSSLGLFTGWGSSGSSGSSSPVDWSTGGSMMQCDYASIDWSLDSAPSRPPSKAGHRHQDWLHDAWATAAFTGARVGRARAGIDGGARVAGRLQDGARLVAMDPLPAAGSHEWTSPFAGKDLFSLSRRFVTSPPL